MGCSKPSEFYAPLSTKSRYAAVYANATSQPGIQLGGRGESHGLWLDGPTKARWRLVRFMICFPSYWRTRKNWLPVGWVMTC